MKDETYYLEKYLLLCDMINNKRDELNRSFDDDSDIARVVRTTGNIFVDVVNRSKITEP
jgi:hypothetical protein